MPEKDNFFDRYGIHQSFIHNDELIDVDRLQNDKEIMELLDIAYEIADKDSPTGTRTPFDIEIIESKRRQLENQLLESQRKEEEDKKRSDAWQAFAERERQKTELSVKKEKLDKIKRLQKALENSEVKELLLLFKVMKSNTTPQKAFAYIKANPIFTENMMRLTLKGKSGGKSRIFRRKNKKTRSKSRRNAQRTRRHRKSSTRRSTRK